MTFNKYPYTNFHEMNLDWILNELKHLTDEWVEFEHTYEGITAQAESVPYGEGASVIVSGGAGTPFNFDFKIPYGKDLKVVSTLIRYGVSESSSDVPTTWTDTVPVIPQAWYLWTRTSINFSDGTTSTFYSISRNGLDGTGSVVSVNNISPDSNGNITLPLPQPSDDTPLSDTTYGSEGTNSTYSRSDHRHVADSTKLDKLNGENIGDKNAYVVEDIDRQTIIPISNTPTANAIAQYSNGGTLTTNEPLNAYDVPRLLDVQNGFVSLQQATNFVLKTDKATSSALGIVKPDNTTINVDNDGVLSAVPSGLTVDIKWTNETPNANFSGQTINNIDTTGYKFIAILYKSLATGSLTTELHLYNRNSTNVQNYTSAGYIWYRNVEIQDDKIIFGDCNYNPTYANGSSTPQNARMIPLVIYGIN